MKIRISELFEIALEEPEETVKAWYDTEANDASEFNVQELQRQINLKLNVIPQERKRYMRQKWTRRALILAAILVMGTVTAFAAANVDLLKEFFSGDTSIVKDQVLSPHTTVCDDEYQMTLEQVLADEHNAVIIVSTEPLTKNAKEKIKRAAGCAQLSPGAVFSSISVEERNADNRDSEEALFSQNFSVQSVTGSGVKIGGMRTGLLYEKSTEDKQYWRIAFNDFSNPQGDAVLMYANQVTNPNLFVEIPLKSELETRKIEMNAPGVYKEGAYTLRRLEITPLSMTIVLDVPAAVADFPEGAFFFRMKDGTIKTKNQLSDLASWSGHQKWNDEDGDDLKGTVITLEGRFQEPLDPAEFVSVIVEEKEYLLADPQQVKKTNFEPTLKQFAFKPIMKEDRMVIPVLEICEALGAEFTWNDKDKEATILYRNKKIKLTVGSSIVLKDEEEIDLDEPVEFYQGQLISPSYLCMAVLNVDIDRSNEEDRPLEDRLWMLTP